MRFPLVSHMRTKAGYSRAVTVTEQTQAWQLDDVRDGLSFGLEEVGEALTAMAADQATQRERDGQLLRARWGLDGQAPQTLTALGTRYELSRDRVRQLYTRAVGEIVRRVRATGCPDTTVFTQRYPREASDRRLVWTLLTETYVTGSDVVAGELAYLQLRLAGHALLDAKRVAGFVFQQVAGWQQRGRWPLHRPHTFEPDPGQLVSLLRRAEWTTGHPSAIPQAPTRTVDTDDDARGCFPADKLRRDVTFDTALEAKLLRILDASELVETFVERPAVVHYSHDRVHCPTVVAQLTDGRVVLIDVAPLVRLALQATRSRLAATRTLAHAQGWGWLVFTGSRLGEPDLLAHRGDTGHESLLHSRLAHGPLGWNHFRGILDETQMDMVDFIAAALRHNWHWQRGPFRLAR